MLLWQQYFKMVQICDLVSILAYFTEKFTTIFTIAAILDVILVTILYIRHLYDKDMTRNAKKLLNTGLKRLQNDKNM